MPFPDATTTTVISCFEIGRRVEMVQVKRVTSLEQLGRPNGHRLIPRERMEREARWSRLVRPERKTHAGYIELGELCRVHRGQVTGANKVWVEGPYSRGLPAQVFFPAVTKARELFEAGDVLDDVSTLRCVIDLPIDLSGFAASERQAVDRFLAWARRLGAHEGYVASNRKAWWSVGLREPAPILATYMARRPPAFVRNLAGAHHINIAHGLYPREPLADHLLSTLAAFLSTSTSVKDGRTYAGGLTKFEPREMEKILVPRPEMLDQSGSNIAGAQPLSKAESAGDP